MPRLSCSLLALLGSMALAAPLAADTRDTQAQAVFRAAYAEICMDAEALATGTAAAAQWDITLPQSYSDAPLKLRLWQFDCGGGAYNTAQAYLLWDEVNGLRPVALPSPVIKVTNADPEDFESKVTAIEITGWQADLMAINSNFDPETLRLSEFSLWRGIGDASSVAVWVLEEGGFKLVQYEVDADYDGESAHQTLVDLP